MNNVQNEHQFYKYFTLFEACEKHEHQCFSQCFQLEFEDNFPKGRQMKEPSTSCLSQHAFHIILATSRYRPTQSAIEDK